MDSFVLLSNEKGLKVSGLNRIVFLEEAKVRFTCKWSLRCVWWKVD